MKLCEMRFEIPLTLCSICASLEPKKGPELHNVIYDDADLSNEKAFVFPFFKKKKVYDHLAFFTGLCYSFILLFVSPSDSH